MVYKKYIKRNGKTFGPYYYESYRDFSGKVKTRFISGPENNLNKKSSERLSLLDSKKGQLFYDNKNYILSFLALFLLLFIFLFIINFINVNKNPVQGNAILSSGSQNVIINALSQSFSNQSSCFSSLNAEYFYVGRSFFSNDNSGITYFNINSIPNGANILNAQVCYATYGAVINYFPAAYKIFIMNYSGIKCPNTPISYDIYNNPISTKQLFDISVDKYNCFDVSSYIQNQVSSGKKDIYLGLSGWDGFNSDAWIFYGIGRFNPYINITYDNSCTKVCNNKECGSDGCGGVCGVCSLNKLCSPDFKCVIPSDFNAPSVSLKYPNDKFISNKDSITLNADLSDNEQLKNASFIVYDANNNNIFSNVVSLSGLNANPVINVVVPLGNYHWNVYACDYSNNCAYASSNFSFSYIASVCQSECSDGQKKCSGQYILTCADFNSDGCFEYGGGVLCSTGCVNNQCESSGIDNTPPSVTLLTPESMSYTNESANYFMARAIDNNQLKSAQLFIWDENNNIVSNNVKTINIDGNFKAFFVLAYLKSVGKYKWNYYVCDSSNNCNWNMTNKTLIYNNCIPKCEGLVCGNDGCGGSCGSCSNGNCVNGACVLNSGSLGGNSGGISYSIATKPPVVEQIQNQKVKVGEQVKIPIRLINTGGGNNIDYKVINQPSNSFFNKSEKILYWTPTNEQVGNYLINFSISNGKYNVNEIVSIDIISAENVNESISPVESPISDESEYKIIIIIVSIVTLFFVIISILMIRISFNKLKLRDIENKKRKYTVYYKKYENMALSGVR